MIKASFQFLLLNCKHNLQKSIIVKHSHKFVMHKICSKSSFGKDQLLLNNYQRLHFFSHSFSTGSSFTDSGFVLTFNVKDDDEFTSRIIHSQIPIIVQFCAEWSNPDADMIPFLKEEISKHPGKLMAASVDVDRFSKLSYRYKIFSVPTLLLFKNGQVVETQEGLLEHGVIMNMIDKALKLT